MTPDAKIPIIHPDCLRRKQFDLRLLAHRPNNTLFELLGLVCANQIASAEIANLDRAILLAFIAAFYKDLPAAAMHAATPPTTPTESDLEELQGLLSARSHVDQQLRGNVDAFNHAWQKMGLGQLATPAG